MKKILHCLQSPSWGGLEMYTVDLITEMQSLGYPQIALCLENSRVHKKLLSRNIKVRTLPAKKISKWKHSRIIKGIYKSEEITDVFSHSRLDLWANALALIGNSSIRHIYNLYMNAVPKRDLVHKWLFSKVSALCSSSEEIINEARINFPIAPEKLKLIRYGRKTEIFQKNPERREEIRTQYGAEGKIVIGTLCRIDSGKGVRELTASLDLLPDNILEKIQLWIVGDPTIVGQTQQGLPIYSEDSQELITWLEEKLQSTRLKNHLKLIPFQKDYVSYIEALDIFALASHKETYSLSVIDAMMMDKPVIGTDAGGTTEQVGEKNERGILVEPRSAQSIADAVKVFVESSGMIATKGAAAGSWARSQHSWKKALTEYSQLL